MCAPLPTHTDDTTLTVCLSGRIDASNAAETEAAIAKARSASPRPQLVIDAEHLTYVSSAGLRVLLRLRKEAGSLCLLNVSPEVYDILEMTGFTEMMTVKKAYRRLSVEGCALIGRGANGAVYRYDAETIVKVYFNPDALPEIRRERELARRALVLGINTAIPYDVVRVGESYGTVMELLEATSLSELIRRDPTHLETPLRYYTELLRQIHSTAVQPGEMPDMKQVALTWAAFDRDFLPQAAGEKLCRLVEGVPERHTMLHGDYHPNNLMVRDGEVLLIDMDTLCEGHPIFELGSMYNAFVGFGLKDPAEVTRFLGIDAAVAETFWHRALAGYLETDDPARLAEAEAKAALVGTMRLLRRTARRSPGDAARITCYREKLLSLLAAVETLEL